MLRRNYKRRHPECERQQYGAGNPDDDTTSGCIPKIRPGEVLHFACGALERRCDQFVQSIKPASDSGHERAEVEEQHSYSDVYTDNLCDERNLQSKRRYQYDERPGRYFDPCLSIHLHSRFSH